MVTAEKIQSNYEQLKVLIKTYIQEPRQSKLLEFYTTHEDRLAFMPASGKEHFHNAFPGGYVDHVLRVIDVALKLMPVWESFGGTINYTVEELVFAALNHDLGKMGDKDNDMYVPNDSEWHRKNQGLVYKINHTPAFMNMADRSLYILQEAGIKCTQTEWIAIKVHDGLYDEANKAYLITREAGAGLRSHMPLLLQQADTLAARVEFERWRAAGMTVVSNEQSTIATYSSKINKQKKKPNIPTGEDLEGVAAIFGNLFAVK